MRCFCATILHPYHPQPLEPLTPRIHRAARSFSPPHPPIVQKYRHCFLSFSRSPQPAAFADRRRLVASRTGSDGKAAPASNDQGARTGGAPHQELLAEPLPFTWTVSSREFVPHHRDEGVSATCSALSHCLLPLCCAARTPRTPHAALALLLLVPRTHRATKP